MVHRFIKEITGIDVGKNYITQFWHKHNDVLAAGYLKPIDLSRKKADNIYLYGLYFDTLEAKIEEYDIQPGNTYNMDEKGFLIGCLNNLRRIFTKEAWEKGELNGAAQDRNRTWITILAAICADGTYLPPAIIYPAKSSDIQDL